LSEIEVAVGEIVNVLDVILHEKLDDLGEDSTDSNLSSSSCNYKTLSEIRKLGRFNDNLLIPAPVRTTLNPQIKKTNAEVFYIIFLSRYIYL
jgi:hypothetical protein